MEIPTHHVDAFTLHAFSGNPAAVCLMPQAVPAGRSGDGVLASIAAEFNLSETAFITPLSAGSNVFEKHDVSASSKLRHDLFVYSTRPHG